MFDTEELEKIYPYMKDYSKNRFDYEINLKFWRLIPSINLNLHSKEIEFEFLCFGFYIKYKR